MDHENVQTKFEVLSFTRSLDNRGYLKTDFGTNRKRVYDFVLVRNSNLSTILHRFGDFTGFLCS